MWVAAMDAHHIRWYSNYDEAWNTREAEGGFLFPYKQQFLIAEGEAVRELGLDPDDTDWELIGWDWVQPLDTEAWERLKEKRELSL